MKVTSQEKLVGAGPGKTDISSLLRYALSLPVSTVVVGMPKREFVAENIAIARGVLADDGAGNRSRPEERRAAAGGGRVLLQRTRGRVRGRIGRCD